LPTPNREPGIFISDAEKNAAIRKGEADLKAWRERNPDAPRGLPPERDDEAGAPAMTRTESKKEN